MNNPHKNVQTADENAQYGFWIRDLTIDGADGTGTDVADKGLYVTGTSFFHFRNLTVTNAKVDAIYMNGVDGAGIYYGVLENVNAVDTNDSANTVDGFELFGNQPNGVHLANVGFYNCESSGNTGRGMNVEGPSITLSRCVLKGNDGVQLRAAFSKSLNVIDCVIKAANSSTVGIYLMKEGDVMPGNKGWMAGFHILGGNLLGTIDHALSTINTGEYGLRQSMIYTETGTTVARSQIGKRYGNLGNVVDATMSPGVLLSSPARTSEEGTGQDP